MIVTAPAATPVTGTVTVPEPAAQSTVAGTVATPALLELRLTVRSLAGGGDRFSVRFWVVPALMVTPPTGEKKLPPPLALTCTRELPGAKPGADAVMLADPGLTPLICGWVAGTLALAAMKTLGVTVTVEESLLVNETVTPPAGAGADKVTGSVTD